MPKTLVEKRVIKLFLVFSRNHKRLLLENKSMRLNHISVKWMEWCMLGTRSSKVNMSQLFIQDAAVFKHLHLL